MKTFSSAVEVTIPEQQQQLSSSSPAPAAVAEAPATAEASSVQVTSAILQFAVASIVMIAGNKAAIKRFPLPCVLVIIQALGTVAILLAFFRNSVGHYVMTFPSALLREWLPISVLFTLMLFTSMQSFVYSGVTTILILRNVGAIVTTAVEYFVRGTTANLGTYASEILIVTGAVLYTGGSVDATPLGLFWILFNVCAQVAYGVLLKHKMETSPAIKELSNFSMSFLNNTLAVPMVLGVLLFKHEQTRAPEVFAAATPWTWFFVLLTCVFGFVISTSGFGLQKLVSAATFLVINNLTKFVNILLGVTLLGDRFDGPRAIMGCCLALGGGVWYSYEQMKLKAAAK